jgi:hypothetical protein
MKRKTLAKSLDNYNYTKFTLKKLDLIKITNVMNYLDIQISYTS